MLHSVFKEGRMTKHGNPVRYFYSADIRFATIGKIGSVTASVLVAILGVQSRWTSAPPHLRPVVQVPPPTVVTASVGVEIIIHLVDGEHVQTVR